MSRYERGRFSTWQRLVIQLSLAATATCLMLGTSEYIGAQNAKADVEQQQEWDQLRKEGELKRVAETEPWDPEPILVISYPENPIEPLKASVKQHQERARGYGWLSLFTVFLAGSATTAGLAQRRRREEEIDELAALDYHPVSSPDEIDPAYIQRFETVTVESSTCDSQLAILDEMLDEYQPTLMERIGYRIADLFARRRERIQEQLDATRYDERFVPMTNYIEPIVFDRQ